MPGNIISITPADIAKWPTPNYIDPLERHWMPAYSGTLFAVSTVMVTLRLWLRVTKQAGALGFDDALLVVAWLGAIFFTTVVIVAATQFDIGRHVWDVPMDCYEKIAQMTWLAELAFLICGGATKISILLFYRRLVDGSYDRRWKWAVIFAVTFTAAWTIAFILTLCFNCTPTEAYWKAFSLTYDHPYTCVNTTAINLLAGIFAIASDLYSVVLPVFMTRNFGLPSSQRLALNGVFALGLLVAAASAARTYYLYEVGQKADVSWLVFDVFVWAQLELQLGITCACLPALRVFFRKYLNVPITRAVQDTHRSIVSRQSNRISDQPSIVIRRISGPDEQYQRDDFSSKHLTKSSVDKTSIAETEVDNTSPSTMTSSHYLVRSPVDYEKWSEAYNMQNMERFRDSYRPTSRGHNARNFSQPFNSYKPAI